LNTDFETSSHVSGLETRPEETDTLTRCYLMIVGMLAYGVLFLRYEKSATYWQKCSMGVKNDVR
jgi:hypothetical protein